MRRGLAVLVGSFAAALLIGGGASQAGTNRTTILPSLAVDFWVGVNGQVGPWITSTEFHVGDNVSYVWNQWNTSPTHALKLTQATITVPDGWQIVLGRTTPKPFSITPTLVTWRFRNIPKFSAKTYYVNGSVIRHVVAVFKVGGQPGQACVTQVAWSVVPQSKKNAIHGCNPVVAGVG